MSVLRRVDGLTHDGERTHQAVPQTSARASHAVGSQPPGRPLLLMLLSQRRCLPCAARRGWQSNCARRTPQSDSGRADCTTRVGAAPGLLVGRSTDWLLDVHSYVGSYVGWLSGWLISERRASNSQHARPWMSSVQVAEKCGGGGSGGGVSLKHTSASFGITTRARAHARARACGQAD